jgi:cold shock CspA family protein
MPYGTVRWFNMMTGYGCLRTDAGAFVFFHNGAIQNSDLRLIQGGTRVSLDILKSKYGLTVTNLKATELLKGHE